MLGVGVGPPKVRSDIAAAVRELFAAGQQGAWYDPADFSTMYQDSAGTTPVTAVGQPVGLILDKRLGAVRGAEQVTNGDFSNGTTGWITIGGASQSVVAGELVVVNTAGGVIEQSQQSLPFSIGQWYEITADVRRVAGTGSAQFIVETNAVALYVGAAITSATAVPVRTIVLVPSGTTDVVLRLRSNGLNTQAGFDNVSVKPLAGNHATQATAASRPTLSARYNQLLSSENFNGADWAKSGCTVVANKLTPTGAIASVSMAASLVTVGGGSWKFTARVAAAGKTHAYLQINTEAVTKASFVTINLSTGVLGTPQVLIAGVTSVSVTSNAVTGGAYDIAWTVTVAADATLIQGYIGACDAQNSRDVTVTGADGIQLHRADIRTSTDAALAIPSYQRVTTATDYDTAGFPLYLSFDGADDSLATGSINFAATNKMTVFAGAQRPNDTLGILTEFSADFNANAGAFYIASGTNGVVNWSLASRGTAAGGLAGFSVTAPDIAVLSGSANIAGDSTVLRRNGVAVSNAGAQGLGNFGNYPLYIGRRGGSTLPFNGRLYSLIVLGAAARDAAIARVERHIAGRMGLTY